MLNDVRFYGFLDTRGDPRLWVLVRKMNLESWASASVTKQLVKFVQAIVRSVLRVR